MKFVIRQKWHVKEKSTIIDKDTEVYTFIMYSNAEVDLKGKLEVWTYMLREQLYRLTYRRPNSGLSTSIGKDKYR